MKYSKERLGNYIEIIPGYAFKSKDFEKSGIPVIKIKNVTPPSVSLEDLSYVPVELANSFKKYELEYDDILIALTGSHINQMASVVGRIARFKFKNTRAMLNQRVGKILTKDIEKLDLDFCYYYLSQESIKIELASQAGGAANQANISSDDVKNLSIPLPSIERQRIISGVLRAYDDLIENNQKQIKLLEEAAMRLYKEWFLKLRFPGNELVRVVNGVPEGWERSKVEDVSSILKRGISPKYSENGNSFVISQKCIRQFHVDFSLARKQDKAFTSEMQLRDGDTVICSTGTGTLGRVGQVFGSYSDCTFDSHVTLVRCNEKIGMNYLAQFLRIQQGYFESMGKGATNQTELSRSVIGELPILIPDEATLNQFESLSQQLRDKTTICKKTIDYLISCRDKLLPKLMNGEIEV